MQDRLNLSPGPSTVTSATLRILATTDLHAHALGWDYYRDEPVQGFGLAALVPLIRQARAEHPAGTVLVDNGDFLQGSPLGDWMAQHGEGTHPLIAAMNALDYDAATLGNHEFSHGLDLLDSALASACFPVVSANVSVTGMDRVRADTMITRSLPDRAGHLQTLRIGITGTAPAQTAIWEARNLSGRVIVTDPLTAARAAVQRLRRHGADIVILLAHTGIDDGTGNENIAVPLADLSGADAIVLGHTHLTFPAGQARLALPAVMAGCFGSHLGCIDLDLEHGPDGWTVTGAAARLLRPATPEPSDAIPPATRRAHDATREWLRQPAGHSDLPLRAHFSRIAPCNLLRLVATAQADHVARTLTATQIDGRPILGSAAPFRTGMRGAAGGCSDIPPGPLTLRQVKDIYPHPNTLVALSVTGDEVADWLERAAIQFTTLDGSTPDRPILRSDCPAFDFDMIDGLSFTIDATVPPRFDLRGTLLDADRHRISGLRHKGLPVQGNDRFILVTNSYRASGSGGFPACRSDRILLDDGQPATDAVASFLASGRQSASDETWHFAPVGLPVLFDAPPGAERYIDDVAHLRPEALSIPSPEGARRFRLWL